MLDCKRNSESIFFICYKRRKSSNSRREKTEDTDELTVSGDGTWKKRGFSSLFGVTSLIGHFTGKVLDIFAKSSYCHECKTWESKLDSAEYEECHEAHVNVGKCQANHTGAAGNIEVEAMKTMFQRSVRNGVRYRNYIGDGD